MDPRTAVTEVARKSEADKQFEEAQQIAAIERRRKSKEQSDAQAQARAERGQAALRAVADWLAECSAGAEKLRAQYGIEFERLLGTPAIPYFADGHETRMELRLAVAGLSYAAEVLRGRLPTSAAEGSLEGAES